MIEEVVWKILNMCYEIVYYQTMKPIWLMSVAILRLIHNKRRCYVMLTNRAAANDKMID